MNPQQGPATQQELRQGINSLAIELLTQDLEARRSHVQAYRLLLSDTLFTSRQLSTAHGVDTMDDGLSDGEASVTVALESTIAALRDELSVEMARKLNASELLNEAVAKGLQVRLEGRERGECVDHEFSRVLQRTDDTGGDSDLVADKGAEAVLGLGRVRELLRIPARLNDGPLIENYSFHGEELPLFGSSVAAGELVECMICFEECSIALADRSRPGPQGGRAEALFIGDKSDRHVYCIPCLWTYIKTKLEEVTTKVFPINCPDCRTVEVTDDIAVHILGAENMEPWHYRRLLDSTPHQFCPNGRCSARVLPNEDGDPQAECPVCKKLVCTPCASLWHSGYTCAQFQALHPLERDPEDFATLELAETLHRRRCRKCRAMIELESGCFHITCPCGEHFCYNCGSVWDQRLGKCTRLPPCALWDEDNLIAENRRVAQRVPAAPAVVAASMVAAELVEPAIPLPGHQWQGSMDWVCSPDLVVAQHPFTRGFLIDLRCGYCNAGPFIRRRALLQHMNDKPLCRRSTFSCCEKFFQVEAHLTQHIDMTRGNGVVHNFFNGRQRGQSSDDERDSVGIAR